MLRAFPYAKYLSLHVMILTLSKVKIAVYASFIANIALSVIQSKFPVPLFLSLHLTVTVPSLCGSFFVILVILCYSHRLCL
jgi:hypothetical protein